jgi:hypothetical protein
VLARDAGGRMVREAASLHAGDSLELEFRDGRVDAETRSVRAGGVREREAAAPTPEPNPQLRRTRRPRGSGQGSLF